MVGVLSSQDHTNPQAWSVTIVMDAETAVATKFPVVLFPAAGVTSHTLESTPRYCLSTTDHRAFEMVNAYDDGSLAPHTRENKVI